MITGKYQGLSPEEVLERQRTFGKNEIPRSPKPQWFIVLTEVFSEPIFLILLFTSALYFLLGEWQEGIIMVVAILFVSGISLFQEFRSSTAEKAMKKILEFKTKVIRSGQLELLPKSELVVGDVIMVEDGDVIPADAVVLESHDLSVNESLLTGESLPVFKNNELEHSGLLQGSTVSSGYAIGKVTGVGINTSLGKIHKSIQNLQQEKTPIQIQIDAFVKKMIQFGVFAFFIILIIQYYISESLVFALLKGLTLSMSILPEEIPVAFSTFMALGALKLYRKNVLAKRPVTVETLGAVTVICLDKTGTITKNEMSLAGIYDHSTNNLIEPVIGFNEHSLVLEYAMWASETAPFDAMEQSIHKHYERLAKPDRRFEFKLIKEYPLSGSPPLMTHVFSNDLGEQIIAVKGGLESLLPICKLTEEEISFIRQKSDVFADKGHRVLGVASGNSEQGKLPDSQFDLQFTFLGLVSFYDPPKENIRNTIKDFYAAGIEVKVLSGDYLKTTTAIAHQIGVDAHDRGVSGSEVASMDEEQLNNCLEQHSIFGRMRPEEKLRVIEALKKRGEVVAMTGDGVNDGPALKAAHIGIAMGKKGSEMAQKFSSLILANDNIETLIDGISLGRRIYENLKKAIQYIISIHIPILLIVTLPLLLFWKYSNFFTPVHVIFLELIMGPICSIAYENEPIEDHSMNRAPRKFKTVLFTWKELSISIIQGLMITVACLVLGYWFMTYGASENKIRTLIYCSLIFSNVLLSLTNRSFYHSILTTLRYRNHIMYMVLVISLLLLGLSIFNPFFRDVFSFVQLTWIEMMLCTVTAAIAVLWIEIYKWRIRKKNAQV